MQRVAKARECVRVLIDKGTRQNSMEQQSKHTQIVRMGLDDGKKATTKSPTPTKNIISESTTPIYFSYTPICSGMNDLLAE
jgi:hypothetical protein